MSTLRTSGASRRKSRTTGAFAAAGALAIVWSAVAVAPAQEPKLGDYFGFLPLEIYKLDNRIGNLVLADLDGDKTLDVIAANNGRSRIDLLLSRKKSVDDEKPESTEANQVPSDGRLRLKSLPVNKEVVSIQAGDFNGDGKTDIAFYGTPAELTILLNDGEAGFADSRRVNVGEAIEGQGALTAGDLNRDGRDDLALITSEEVVVVRQTKEGKLADPERTSHTLTKPGMIKALDLDGDGGVDLIMLDNGDPMPIRARFSTADGRLGPEQRFKIEPLRAYNFADMDGKSGQEILTIEAQSGRARIYALEEGAEDESLAKRGRLMFFPLPRGNARGRELTLGDLDGDGKTDVVVTDPGNAQVFLYLQGKAGQGLGSVLTFPSLSGGKTAKAADLDGDGKAELYVLSEQEKQLGRALLKDGRLTFPEPLAVVGEPVALELADLDGDRTPEILYVSRQKAKSEGDSETFDLRALKQNPNGSPTPWRWGRERAETVSIPGLNGAPPAIEALDVNRDGETDVLVFNSYGTPVLFLGKDKGTSLSNFTGGLGPLSDASPSAINQSRLDGAALIVAQKTFARDVVLDKAGQWLVKDQFNSGRANASILAAAPLDADGDGRKEVVMLDRSNNSLIFLDREAGAYRPAAGTLPIGAIDFQGFKVADLDGDGRDDLIIAGGEKFGVLLTGNRGRRLKPIASYESRRQEARFGDLIAGDLNGDGSMDLVVADVIQHYLEFASYLPKRARFERALSFRIFEQKSFRDVSELFEPRDMAVGDVDGDRRDDLVLIVHDRILIYRQDPGPSPKSAAKKD